MPYSPIATRSTEVFTPDRLLVDTKDVRTRKVTLASGQNLTRGAVLGIITTGGNATLSASAASDGSQTPRFVLAENCNASGGARECVVYETGTFNGAALTLGAGHTLASIREGLRGLGIYIQTIQGA